MQNTTSSPQEVGAKIEAAKDSFDVITPRALHDQLGSLSPQEWREAANIYKKTSGDDFFITDDANGKVTIHNDFKEVTKTANESVLDATGEDAKYMADYAVKSIALASLAGGITDVVGIGVTQVGFWAAAGSTALWSGALAAVVGGVAVVGDLGRNYFRQAYANDELADGPRDLTIEGG